MHSSDHVEDGGRGDMGDVESPWRLGGEACPRCGYEVAIPLKPSDSQARRVWDFYCTRCGYTWTRKEPVEDVF
jgi:DNA-directed RNA polymerase subunit RPC12/RpoP